MPAQLSEQTLDQLFRAARTYHGFLDRPIDNATLQALYHLTKWGPTAANSLPLRITFARSAQAKEKLTAALNPGNIAKMRSAPVTAILGCDHQFYEYLPRLYPATDARSWFAGKPVAIEQEARRSATLQAGYLILAARALGMDCGPMGGFDQNKVDEVFFANTQIKSFLLVNLGYGDPEKIFPRGPRFEFDEVCTIE